MDKELHERDCHKLLFNWFYDGLTDDDVREIDRILKQSNVIKDRVLKELEKHMSPKNVHIQMHNIFDR